MFPGSMLSRLLVRLVSKVLLVRLVLVVLLARGWAAMVCGSCGGAVK